MGTDIRDFVVYFFGFFALVGILQGVDNIITRRAYNRDKELEKDEDAVSIGWRRIGFSLLLFIFVLIAACARLN